MIFYRIPRITCLVGQLQAGLVQFSSSLCLLPGLCKELLGPFGLETWSCAARSDLGPERSGMATVESFQ